MCQLSFCGALWLQSVKKSPYFFTAPKVNIHSSFGVFLEKTNLDATLIRRPPQTYMFFWRTPNVRVIITWHGPQTPKQRMCRDRPTPAKRSQFLAPVCCLVLDNFHSMICKHETSDCILLMSDIIWGILKRFCMSPVAQNRKTSWLHTT